MIKRLRMAIAKALTGLSSSVSPANAKDENFHRDIYGRRIKDAEVFFYPQKIRGIPVFDIESVLKHYHKEIRELRNFVPIGDHQVASDGRDLFTTMYLDIIYRFAEYIHLIPASEDHHHRGPGGLLLHSIQTAHKALVFAENKKYKKSGFIDIDKEMATRAKYAAWVAGLMHDTGKILRDIHVDAVEQIDKNGKTSPAQNVVTWAPHLQTLIEWAKTNKVATYSISYVRNRIHNAHNMDSSHLLPYILGRSDAMKYLVEAPGDNLYSEISKILSGIESDSYIGRAVKEGDAYSTMADMGVYHDIMTGAKNLSVGSRVVTLMKIAKANWQWNTPGGEGWIIGGHCYMRWPNAIQSIVKESIKLNLPIPHDTMALVLLMENHGLVKRYDEKHRALKFTKGQYSEEDVLAISNGSKHVQWEELIRVTWDGHLFGDDPKPHNCKGVLFLPETQEYMAIDRTGQSRFFVKSQVQISSMESAVNTELSKQPSVLVSHTVQEDKHNPLDPKPEHQIQKQKLPTKAKNSPKNHQASSERSKTHPVVESVDIDTSVLDDATKHDVESSKGIVFKRTEKTQEAINEIVNENPKIPKPIQDLISKGAKFWLDGEEVYIEVDTSIGIGAHELKTIKGQHLAIDQGAGASLAKNITLGGRTLLAAKLRTPIAKILTLAGVASEPQHIETAKPEKNGTPHLAESSLASDSKLSEVVQPTAQLRTPECPNNSNDVVPPPLEYETEPQLYTEGNLGWILECAGIDLSKDEIEFDKRVVKAAAEDAGRKLVWTKIESILRNAGHTVKSLEEGRIVVSKSALHVSYWETTK